MHRTSSLLVLHAAAWCALVLLAAEVCSAVTATAAALAALRHGGLVVVIAHGPVGEDEEDLPTVSLDDCATQRSLTDTGRLMASGIGKLFHREHVAVDAVLSSRYCRGIETAERIALHTHPAAVRGLDELSEAQGSTPPAERARRMLALRRLAATAPPAGTNTVVVTHRSNIAGAFAPMAEPVRDGELFIFRPVRGAGSGVTYRLAHRLRIEDLSAHARSMAPS